MYQEQLQLAEREDSDSGLKCMCLTNREMLNEALHKALDFNRSLLCIWTACANC